LSAANESLDIIKFKKEEEPQMNKKEQPKKDSPATGGPGMPFSINPPQQQPGQQQQQQ